MKSKRAGAKPKKARDGSTQRIVHLLAAWKASVRIWRKHAEADGNPNDGQPMNRCLLRACTIEVCIRELEWAMQPNTP